jgi:hypothetical protein
LGDESLVSHGHSEPSLLVDGLVLEDGFVGKELAEELDILDDDFKRH